MARGDSRSENSGLGEPWGAEEAPSTSGEPRQKGKIEAGTQGSGNFSGKRRGVSILASAGHRASAVISSATVTWTSHVH